MSQSDKTRQKLVDSMRKTKSGATAKSESAATVEPDKVDAVATKKPTASRTKPAPKRSGKKPVADNSVDSYQSVRHRVWPD
jgi:hypothetical protein